MYADRLLQINMAAVACLATLFLGMGERSTALPLGMFVAAMLSVWITDFKGWFRLSKRMADVAAVAALAVCLPGALRLEKIAIISSVAHFIVCLQVIHLFREKDPAVYWHLLRFSILQVVVASLLSQEIAFGVLLVVYLFMALAAMGLLFFSSEWRRHHGRAVPPAEEARGRWPLAAQEAVFWSGPTGRVPLGREFFGRLFKIGTATLLVAILVFVSVPRFGRGAWRGFGGMARPTVGFSGRVRLGELGKVAQNPEEVMRVRLLEGSHGAVYRVSGGLYLRGAVLTEYRHGEWRPPAGTAGIGRGEWAASDPPIREAPVRQEIQLEPLDRDELFCVWPFTFVRPDRRIVYYPRAQRLTRLSGLRRDRFTYLLGTTAFWDHEQVTVVPNEEPVAVAPLLQMPAEEGRNPLPGLCALAAQWVAESGLPPADQYGRASTLERRLRGSNQFTYSLEGQDRDGSLDPVEDFITKHPRGHCEYFATALCLMLRSQGIPARVVIGFHTAEFNELGKFFQVRQLCAHSWVEAYLTPDQIPASVLRERPSWQWPQGAWIRLDATPSSEEMSPALSLLANIGGLFNQINFAWTNYVMEMDRPRQRDAIYHPVADALRKVFRAVTDPFWWQEVVAGVAHFLGLDRWLPSGGVGFSWFTLIAVLVACVLAIGIFKAAAIAYARWIVPLRSASGRRRGNALASVRFYRRFEKLLAKRGLARRLSETQREFALAASAKIAGRTGSGQITRPALEVVEAFYRVRFGGATLDETQAQAVEHALGQVQEAVARRKQVKP